MTRKGSFVNFIPTERGNILWRVEEGWLEYKFETDEEWTQVFEIPVEQHTTWTELSVFLGRLRYRHANGTGGHGSYVTPNLNYEFRVEGDYLQFRYGTHSTYWTNILDLSGLGGAGGIPEFREHEGWIQWRIADQDPEADWENLFQLPTQVEFREHEGWLQWRYVGEEDWENLFEIAREVEFREDGDWIQWRYIGEENWENLFQLPTEVEFREHEGWVQWRYVGGTWENLFEIPEVTGTGGGVKGLKIAMIGQ